MAYPEDAALGIECDSRYNGNRMRTFGLKVLSDESGIGVEPAFCQNLYDGITQSRVGEPIKYIQFKKSGGEI